MLQFRDYIQSETLAQNISQDDMTEASDISRSIDIEGKTVVIALKKI